MDGALQYEAYLDVMRSAPLFVGMPEGALRELLRCLSPAVRRFGAGEALLREQETVQSIGILLAGNALASQTDDAGRRAVAAELAPGSVFGDVLAAGEDLSSPVTVTALNVCAAAFLPYDRVLARCGNNCAAHQKLTENLLKSIAAKYFSLQARIDCLVRPTLREKLLHYLGAQAARAGSDTFRIPFDRAALADYLNADRSALSRELSRLRDEGLVDSYKNSFRFLKK